MNAALLQKLLDEATPRPWKVCGPDEFCDFTIRHVDQTLAIAAVVNGEMRRMGGKSDEHAANACLIVLAPKLAAEVIRLQTQIEAFEAGARKVLPLMEAASREEVTDTADWDEAEAMLRAALGEASEWQA